jgi:biopolymer transport protein ExbD
MRFRAKKPTRAVIPTASMADIAFLLIVFFMLTSVFATEKGLQIVLPEKGEEVKIKKSNIADVFVNAQGQVRINNEDVSLEEIKDKVSSLLAENDSLVFSLTADRRCKYKMVIKVFDQMKLGKAERIAFAPPKKVE